MKVIFAILLSLVAMVGLVGCDMEVEAERGATQGVSEQSKFPTVEKWWKE